MRTEIQILASTFTAVGTSAWETLLEVNDRARKDVAKIQRWLESDEVSRAKRATVVTAQWAAAVLLAVGAVCFVLGQEARVQVDRFVESSLGARDARHTVLGEAIAPVPDVDLPSIGELFAEADQVGDRYLTPQEIEERDAALAAIAQVFVNVPPHRPGGGRRRYIERLLDQAGELKQLAAVSDAALLTVAQVAVNALE